MSPQFFYMLEQGEMSTENMKIKNIRKIGEVLGVNYWEFVD